MRPAPGRLLALLALLGLVATPAWAQTGTLAGRVMDAETGETIANAVVRVLEPGGQEVAGDLTDADGRFELRVAPGTYDVEVTSLGFATRRIETTVAAQAGEPMSIALVAEADGRRQTVFSRGDASPLRAPELDLPSLLDGAAAVVIDGSCPDAQRALAELAVRRRIPVVLDAAAGDEPVLELVRLADVVVCAERLAAEIAGRSAP